MWPDRLLMLLEIAVLLYMVKLDRSNHQAIQEFLRSRTEWYARRAQMKKPPETGQVADNETVAVLSEDGQNEPQ